MLKKSEYLRIEIKIIFAKNLTTDIIIQQNVLVLLYVAFANCANRTLDM